MSEEQLKRYWQAYTDAWMLMKNWKKVMKEHIEEMLWKHDIGVMRRLFCLAVWQEIKRVKAGGEPLLEKDCQRAFTYTWKLFKQYSEPNDSDEYWDGLIDGIKDLGKEFGESQFIKNLLIHVLLEEIERIYREKNDTVWMIKSHNLPKE